METEEDYDQEQFSLDLSKEPAPQTKKQLNYKGQSIRIEQLLERIISYKSHEESIPLLQKFSIPFLISIIERDKISELEKVFKEYDKKGVDIIDFVRIFLNIIEHNEEQTLYLVMALVEFFRLISETMNMANFIKYVDITNYICESFDDNLDDQHILKTRKLPKLKRFNVDQKRVREIDINAPIIYGHSEELIRRLVPSKLETDSSHHNNQNIKMGCYASEISKIFSLDSLSEKINIYNVGCKLEKVIIPKLDNERSDVIVMSIN